MSQYLHALHDRGGEHLHADKPGWTIITEAIGADPGDTTGRDYRDLSDRGFSVIVRLNHGYGNDGTIPTPDRYGDFARRVGAFVRASQGCTRWIIGNEPNHAQERPNGQPITAAQYAECFARCVQALRAVGSEHQAILAAIAPWNTQTGDWLAYFVEMVKRTNGYAGGIALHTYTHGPDPALVTSEARMQPPFANRRFHFRAYRDFLEALPDGATGLPVYITETNQDAPWLDQNTGWVGAAYAEIDAWNHQPDTQKIHCLALYRWSRDDQWHIDGKFGVQADFKAAVARGYSVPAHSGNSRVDLPASTTHTVHLPNVPNGSAQPAPQYPKRIWDMRLSDRGVRIATPGAAQLWYVTMGRWLDESEAGGRHHIFVDVLDEAGNRVTGVPLNVIWPGGGTQIVTEAKPGEAYAANFPMSPSRNEFSIRVGGALASEIVTGIGMGQMTPDGYNAGIHTSTVLHFQRVSVAQAQPTPTSPSPVPPAPPTPVPTPELGSDGNQSAQVPPLTHPVADGALRAISQRFGESPAKYARFGLAGHNGIDFAVPIGSWILAAADGTVQEAGELPDYGIYVKLRHPWGETVYAHLSELGVDVGAPVAAGTLIGLSGNTGNSTGPHLHFGLRVYPYTRGAPYDGYSDPLPYLQQGHAKPALDIPGLIAQQAKFAKVDGNLLASLVWAESSFEPAAVSSAGAMGLCQIMPSTWAEWSAKVGATNPWEPDQNLAVGAAYLAWLLRQTKGDTYKALHAYAWGIGNVLSGATPPDDVYDYADKIMHGRDLLAALSV